MYLYYYVSEYQKGKKITRNRLGKRGLLFRNENRKVRDIDWSASVSVPSYSLLYGGSLPPKLCQRERGSDVTLFFYIVIWGRGWIYKKKK